MARAQSLNFNYIQNLDYIIYRVDSQTLYLETIKHSDHRHSTSVHTMRVKDSELVACVVYFPTTRMFTAIVGIYVVLFSSST